MQFAATIGLSLIPVAIAGVVAVSRPTPPVPVKPVPTEGVRMIRMDTQTFRGRWRPLYDVAPATVIREVPVETVATVPAAIEASSSRPPARRIVRRASLRLDICARHGMSKVVVQRGRWQGWRCRR